MTETDGGKLEFRIELMIALVVTGLACCAGFSNILLASNDSYVLTSDALGHMAKISYLADHIIKGELPAWFPYWYNGTALTQYYPPLSYWLMTPIYLLTENVTLSFKIYCFITLYVGGMGVWLFCRSNIGRWCGLFGIIVFCLQPFILLTLFKEGQIAQAPIIALTPWYLMAILSFGQKQNARGFLTCTVLCALMILSHPNTIFMICLYIMIALTIFLFLKKIAFHAYAYIGLSILFAGILTTFWSLVGVTELETPGVPYLYIGNFLLNTASIQWFTSNYELMTASAFLFFAIPVSIGSLAAILMYTYFVSIKMIDKTKSYYILFCIMMTLISIVLSFGHKLPFFNYLPMAENFMAGRILNLASVTAAILCSYLVYELCTQAGGKRAFAKVSIGFLCISIVVSMVYFMNPYYKNYVTYDDAGYKNVYSNINLDSPSFNKGRHDLSIATYNMISGESYFPVLYDLNISEGHNIEGTPHNRAILNHNAAVDSNNYNYIAKNFAFWNVRSYFITKDFEEKMRQSILKYSFEKKGEKETHSLYVSNQPSSYFLIDRRNTLILGVGSPGVAIEFPYLVNEFRNDITDYTYEELEKYKLIYLCEPEVGTIQKKEHIEKMIEKLVNKGVTVIIEPTIGNFSIFDVSVSYVNPEHSPTIKEYNNSQINSNLDSIAFDKGVRYYTVLFGLDDVYYKLDQNDGRLQNDIIGTVKVGDGEVLFIGMQLSHYLKAVYSRNWGVQEDTDYPECTEEVNALYGDIFKTYGANTSFWPDTFPVKKADWNYKGVTFLYSSLQDQELTLSVTYTPRWRAELDGEPIMVGQRENLITLDLPAGQHEVKLSYGITKYGIAGYVISLVGLIIFILFLIFYDIIMYQFRQICTKIRKYLQLDSED